MAIFARRDEGYTRGGMDVESAINLFFKGVLLFPIFLLAGYIGVTMMKHMIFHGIPSMNRPTPEQIERLQERDSQIGSPVVTEMQREETLSPAPVPQTVEEPKPVVEPKPVQEPVLVHEQSRKEWLECISDSRNVVCAHLHPGQKPSFGEFY